MAGEQGKGFAIEVLIDGKWVVCEHDGEVARFDSVADAETEVRWSIDADVTWRVVAAEVVS